MLNPILQQMQSNRSGGMQSLIKMLRSKSPADALNALASSNPQFRQFYEQNRDLPVGEICRRYNIDPAEVERVMKSF